MATIQNVPIIDTNSGQTFAAHPPQQVWLKPRWSQAWVAAPYVWCHSLTLAAGPDISHAQLEWRFGVGLQQGQSSFASYEPIDVLGWYVKIVCGGVTWLGLIEEDIRQPAGLLAGEQPSGVQSLQAYGLDILLTRRKIVRSFLADGGPFNPPTVVGRGIPFNAGTGTGVDAGDASRGNKAGLALNLGFSPAMDPGLTEEWSAAGMLAYLLFYEMPADGNGNVVIPFTWDATNLGTLTGLAPPIDTDSRPVKDVLDELIDRRRLVGYTWRTIIGTNPANPDRLQLQLFTFTDTPFPLPVGGTVPANANLKALQFDFDLFTDSVEVVRRAQQTYHNVLARGARRTGTATFENAQNTLAGVWTADQKTAYNAAASGGDDYPAGMDEEDYNTRDNLNATVRASESLRPVFSHFAPPANWEGKVGDPLEPLCPVLNTAGEPTENSEPFWRPGLRFMRELPLVAGLDYSQEIPPPNSTPQELRRPFAMYLEEDGSYSFLDRRADRMNHPHAEEDRLTVGVRALDEGFAVELAAYGQPPHSLAGAEFVPLADTSDVEAALDWQKISLTACVEFDAHVLAAYPATPPQGLDFHRLLVIDVPDARLDYLAPQTVVDLDDNAQPVRAWGGFVRDDRPRLRNIARLAYAWYATERQALTVTLKGIFNTVKVGDLITRIGEAATLQSINTVVTSVRYDFDAGTTTFQTDYAEFDARGTR